MVEPTGYTALDLIGFTDKGPYDPTANYVRNDLVHVGNSTWRCKIDDTTGITPTEGANWTIFIESATSLAGMSDVDLNTPKAGDGLVHDGNDWTNIPIMTKEQWKKNGAYNLCPINGVTEVKQDVTFSVNSDGTISANGTASGDIYYTVASATFTVDKTGSYRIVGRPVDITGTCNLFVYVAADGGAVLTDSDGTGATGTLTAGVVYGVSIYVASGVNISNKTFKPLLTTDLNATYDDYVPYAKTNRELTEDTKYVVGTLNTAAFTGTGMTLRSGYLYKYGKVVNFIFDIKKDSGTDPLVTYGLLPVGFRPITLFSDICIDGSAYGISSIQITNSGDLNIFFGSTGYAIGCVTFITND